MKKKKAKGWGIFANWLIDVSKYMMTGVILSAFFRDMESKLLFYVVSIAFLVLILVIGIKIKNKEDEEL